MENKDRQILEHIHEYCVDVADIMSRFNNDYSVFENDKVYYYACSMAIFQIGELSGHLSELFRNQTKSVIPWPSVKRVRNLLGHDYGNTDKAALWNMMENDVPAMDRFCMETLQHGGMEQDIHS